jgi:rhodanese-related sulfurtransferase
MNKLHKLVRIILLLAIAVVVPKAILGKEISQPPPKVTGCGKGDDASTPLESKLPPVVASSDRHPMEFRCLSPVEEIYPEWKKGDVWLVDVRSAREYQKQTIPDALNMPGSLVKHKHQLKQRHTVLFNAGYRLSELEVLCHQLKANGFERVSVLQGGIEAWQQAGYPLKGETQAWSELTPSAYMSALNERTWTLISLDRLEGLMLDLAGANSVIEYHHDFNALTSQIGEKLSVAKPGELSSFLVVSRTGEGYSEIRKGLSDRGLREIYYLSGGIDGLRRYLINNRAQLTRKRKGFKEPVGCSG